MIYKKVGVGVVCLFAVLELCVRLVGLTDFPVYTANNSIGYIPSPSQSGSYLRTNDWIFNSKSMGAGEFLPSAKTDVLLVGDSIVLGGNPYKQKDRLASRLNQIDPGRYMFWPISAGSWALQNELTYLDKNKDVVAKVDEIWFVLNSADFGEPSSWACELTHPTHTPYLGVAYVFQKFLYSFERCDLVDASMKVQGKDVASALKQFLVESKIPVKFFLYINKKEYADESQARQFIDSASNFLQSVGAKHVSVNPRDGWPVTLFRDNIHPTPEGTEILARNIFRSMR